MREEPAPEPPAGLGERVMSRIRAHRPSLWKVVGEALLRPREVSFHPLNALRSPVSGQECSFYFIMVGVFYAILGVILMVGLHKLGASLVTPGWVRWQPQIALVTAGVHGGDRPLSPEGREAGPAHGPDRGPCLPGLCPSQRGLRIPGVGYPRFGLCVLLSTLIGLPTGFFLIRTIQNCGKRYA